MSAVGQAGGLPSVAAFTAAVLINVGANAVVVQAWRAVLSASGVALGFRAAAWVWSVSQLARYALGAAQVGGRAVAGRRYGLSPTAGAATALVEIGWQTSITATLVLATSPWWLPAVADLRWLAILGVPPAAVLVAGLLWPRRLLAWLGWLAGTRPVAWLTRGRLGGAVERVSVDRAAAARLTALYALNSALRLSAFAVLFAAVGGDLGAEAMRVVGAYAVGQLVGRLAVFVPGGIGPREGATALVLAPAIGGGPALVLVTAVRLAEIVGEAIFAAGARAGRPAPPAT